MFASICHVIRFVHTHTHTQTRVMCCCVCTHASFVVLLYCVNVCLYCVCSGCTQGYDGVSVWGMCVGAGTVRIV